MILTSEKVVGNVGEQWKEVRDNRVKNRAKQSQEQEKTCKVIVPVDGTVQQVQTTNNFAILEIEEGDKEDNNQLVLVEISNVDRSHKVSPRVTKNGTPRSAIKLNPKASVFNPNDKGIETVCQLQKESTTQWVSRNFGGGLVSTNRSCQQIPSQTVDTAKSIALLMEEVKQQASGGKLWSEQIEEDSEEGEIPDAMEDDDISTKYEVEEKQGVNEKAKEHISNKQIQCEEGSIASRYCDPNLMQNPNQTTCTRHSIDQVGSVDPGETNGVETMLRNESEAENNTTLTHTNDELGGTSNIMQKDQMVSSTETQETAGKEKGCETLIPKHVRTELGTQVNTKEYVGILGTDGKDLDDESTTQNFLNIARQGDISPRQMEKGKLAGRGRKK
ncbi:uncharacterized protein LOC107805125 [Nicotiana tabacum]|uniref:Uncharacterized protein LOC107805125 n=1 Tax=Nicotiana tabacum TaxID=4097 RepID=A0A1S4B6U6_TOBAC|nr:PREDICTED: uncharacterized protein LOC107805125 [Nicotiana tabacum]